MLVLCHAFQRAKKAWARAHFDLEGQECWTTLFHLTDAAIKSIRCTQRTTHALTKATLDVLHAACHACTKVNNHKATQKQRKRICTMIATVERCAKDNFNAPVPNSNRSSMLFKVWRKASSKCLSGNVVGQAN